MEDERRPLCGAELLQDDQHRKAHRIVECDSIGGVDGLGVAEDRLGGATGTPPPEHARGLGSPAVRRFDAVTGDIHEQAAAGLHRLASQPAVTVFGARGDYLGFRRQWRRMLTLLTEVSVPRRLHFPMNHDPTLVAAALRFWQAEPAAADMDTGPHFDGRTAE